MDRFLTLISRIQDDKALSALLGVKPTRTTDTVTTTTKTNRFTSITSPSLPKPSNHSNLNSSVMDSSFAQGKRVLFIIRI